MTAHVHMNGRVYSAELGKMMSPDPVTQFPNMGRNYNKYTYALNNPLKYTDPTGYTVDRECYTPPEGERWCEGKPHQELDIPRPDLPKPVPERTGRSSWDPDYILDPTDARDSCALPGLCSEPVVPGESVDFGLGGGGSAGGGVADSPGVSNDTTNSDVPASETTAGWVLEEVGDLIEDNVVDPIAEGLGSVGEGLSQDFSNGFWEGLVNFTGGQTGQDFFDQWLDSYTSTSAVVGFFENADRTAVSVAVGGSVTRTWGGYSAGQYVLGGFQNAPHLGSQAATLRLVAGTTAINFVVITGSYEVGNALGAFVRVGTNRGAISVSNTLSSLGY